MTASQTLKRGRRVRGAAPILTALLFALVGPVLASAPAAAGGPAAQPPEEGAFTGRFDRGVPIYRLPSMTVSARPTRQRAAPGRSTRQRQAKRCLRAARPAPA
jgi:hypothetical protein